MPISFARDMRCLKALNTLPFDLAASSVSFYRAVCSV